MDLANAVKNGFKNACQELLQEGYRRAMQAVDPNMEEEDVTSELVEGMHRYNEGLFKKPIYIDWEAQEKSEYNFSQVNSASEASRVDLILAHVGASTTSYLIEAKRLKASERFLHREYWNNGVERFVTGVYAGERSIGSMAGYVLEGSVNTNQRYVADYGKKHKQRFNLDLPWTPQASPAEIDVYKTIHSREGSPDIMLDHYLLDFVNISPELN